MITLAVLQLPFKFGIFRSAVASPQRTPVAPATCGPTVHSGLQVNASSYILHLSRPIMPQASVESNALTLLKLARSIPSDSFPALKSIATMTFPSSRHRRYGFDSTFCRSHSMLSRRNLHQIVRTGSVPFNTFKTLQRLSFKHAVPRMLLTWELPKRAWNIYLSECPSYLL